MSYWIKTFIHITTSKYTLLYNKFSHRWNWFSSRHYSVQLHAIDNFIYDYIILTVIDSNALLGIYMNTINWTNHMTHYADYNILKSWIGHNVAILFQYTPVCALSTCQKHSYVVIVFSKSM